MSVFRKNNKELKNLRNDLIEQNKDNPWTNKSGRVDIVDSTMSKEAWDRMCKVLDKGNKKK